MFPRIGFGLLLSLFLLPVAFGEEQPRRIKLSDWLDDKWFKSTNPPPSVLRDNRVSLMIYQEGQAASALPYWWHHPASMIQVVEVVHQDRLGQQGGIKFSMPPSDSQYLGPRGPIIQEEGEAKLGFER